MAVYTDLLRYRELFANLFRRNFQAKYRGSVLGIAWSLVNPLALMAVYLLVFGVLFPNETPHYAIYLLAGLTCWVFFATSLQAAARSLLDSAELIKKVRFPRQLVPFAVVATQLVTFAAMLAILVVLSLVFIPSARSTVWLAIPLAALFACLVAGMSLAVACLNVLLRDLEDRRDLVGRLRVDDGGRRVGGGRHVGRSSRPGSHRHFQCGPASGPDVVDGHAGRHPVRPGSQWHVRGLGAGGQRSLHVRRLQQQSRRTDRRARGVALHRHDAR